MKLKELPEHHAILLTHLDRKSITDALWEELQADSLSHRFFNQTVLDIDTARQIISWAKSSYDGKRIALISFHTIGIPAQNALLKILEEPEEKTRFILVTSNRTNLIETVLSRLCHHIFESGEHEDTADAKLYLETASTERMKLDFISKLLAKTDEEDRKDREALSAFILSLSSLLVRDASHAKLTTELFEVASYTKDPSSSGKALLEYLSLLLPQTKV
jgi:DNA polymerase III delta prime subunit